MNDNKELAPINRILKMLRLVEDISGSALAKQLGLSPSYISEIEKGQKNPTLRVLEAYGQFFGISPADLLYLQEGNLHASNTELLFKVLEKKLEAMEAASKTDEAVKTKTQPATPRVTSSRRKPTRKATDKEKVAVPA